MSVSNLSFGLAVLMVHASYSISFIVFPMTHTKGMFGSD